MYAAALKVQPGKLNEIVKLPNKTIRIQPGFLEACTSYHSHAIHNFLR